MLAFVRTLLVRDHEERADNVCRTAPITSLTQAMDTRGNCAVFCQLGSPESTSVRVVPSAPISTVTTRQMSSTAGCGRHMSAKLRRVGRRGARSPPPIYTRPPPATRPSGIGHHCHQLSASVFAARPSLVTACYDSHRPAPPSNHLEPVRRHHSESAALGSRYYGM